MTQKEHNGWYNYETWLVNLWMDSEEGTQAYWREQAKFLVSPDGLAAHRSRFASSFTDDEVATLALAEQLQERHEEMLPKLEGFAADLLNAAMSEVNWHEIAKHWVEEEQQQTA